MSAATRIVPNCFRFVVAAVADHFVVCPVCFEAIPLSLAVAFDDDGNGSSDGACVDTRGATPP